MGTIATSGVDSGRTDLGSALDRDVHAELVEFPLAVVGEAGRQRPELDGEAQAGLVVSTSNWRPARNVNSSRSTFDGRVPTRSESHRKVHRARSGRKH
jgi:hypothetical protein